MIMLRHFGTVCPEVLLIIGIKQIRTLHQSERLIRCSDYLCLAGAEGFEPSTCGFGDRLKSFYKAIYIYLYYFFTTFISNLPHPPKVIWVIFLFIPYPAWGGRHAVVLKRYQFGTTIFQLCFSARAAEISFLHITDDCREGI